MKKETILWQLILLVIGVCFVFLFNQFINVLQESENTNAKKQRAECLANSIEKDLKTKSPYDWFEICDEIVNKK